MKIDEISKLAQQLSYRDKLSLAQRLLQIAIKEEEEQNPDRREASDALGPLDPELVQSHDHVLKG